MLRWDFFMFDDNINQIQIYQWHENNTRNFSKTNTTKELQDDEFEIILIHNGILDDSVSAMRIVMVVKKKEKPYLDGFVDSW